jgi:hypothetical protein
VRLLRNPLARLGVALSAAVLGLSVATAAAVADPTDETTPPSSETTETTPTTETTETSVPSEPTEPSESTEPSAPPSSSPSEEQPSTEPTGKEPEQKSGDEPSVRSIRDMQMSVTFDKQSYNTGEKMSISVTLKNAGPDEQTVRTDFFSLNPDAVSVEFPNPFDTETLAPGASVTHTIKGAVGNPATTTGKLYAFVYPQGGGDTKVFEFAVPIKQTTGHVSGTVYTDRNDNGKFDAGEGQSGVTLTWNNRLYFSYSQTATTNAAGEFSLTLPTGPYGVSGTGPDGLVIGYRPVDVGQSGISDLLLRAVGPVTGLSVDLAFTKDTYARDEAPVVRVTLTNDGDRPLNGIVAGCNRAGFDNELQGVDDGWGNLSYLSDGVTLAPHSTTVLEVTEPMPAGAYDYGYVVVACDFGYPGADSLENPGDLDMAAVPGQRGDLNGKVADDNTPVAGVRLVLVSPDDDCSVAEATTDAEGKFAFTQVPVGNYDLYVLPPAGWHVEYDNPTPTNVVGSYTGSMYIELAPGDAAAPTLPADCPTAPAAPPAPAPQGRPAPAGLAETGASIAVPGIIGLLAVLTGAGAVIATRRRKQAKES